MKQLPRLPGQLGSSYLPAPNPPPHSAVWGQAGLCRQKRGGMGEEETLASPAGLQSTGLGHPQDAHWPHSSRTHRGAFPTPAEPASLDPDDFSSSSSEVRVLAFRDYVLKFY